MAFHVYVLISQSTARRYVGQTDDLERRLEEHNAPPDAPTRRYTARDPGPWTLIHHETFDTRAQAMRREKWLKSGVGREWLNRQFGRAFPPPAD